MIKDLNDLARNVNYSHGVMNKSIEKSYEIFKRNMSDGSVLEIGPAEGVMTCLLYRDFEDITILEGAQIFCESLQEKFPRLKVEHNVIEKFSTEKKFDYIILGHVLEHVDDPVSSLKIVDGLLQKDGKVFTVVPNANSLHRLAAVKMGILSSKYELNESDLIHGHKRVYDLEGLVSDFRAANLNVCKTGGYWLKPLSNAQLQCSWTDQMIDAFMDLGEQLPEFSGEIYCIGEKKFDE